MDTTPPIQVTRGPEGRLVVLLPYSPERVAKIKTIPGRRWHLHEKRWSVPDTADMPARERLTMGLCGGGYKQIPHSGRRPHILSVRPLS